MSLVAGTRLGPYEIQSAIGVGGMGEVYKARDTRLDRTVAIKVLPAELSSDPERRARFEREARAIAALNHPHICTLHDIGTHEGTTYLVMEHLPGQTLADRLLKGPLPVPQALDIAAQIADALNAAHKHGIIHRDLKPGNVMLTGGGAGRSGATAAKLLDFGLAKLAAQGERPALVSETYAATEAAPVTARGTILGTLQYMAPEQLEGKEADARSDLWALGAMLYEMTAGRRAFEGKSQANLIGAIMTAEPPPLSAVQPLAPAALDRLVRASLAKDPDERWQSAADVKRELLWIGDEYRMTQTLAEAQPATTRGIVAAARKVFSTERAVWSVVVAVLALALMIVTGRHLSRWSPEAPVVRLEVPLPPQSDLQTLAVSPDGRWILFVVQDEGGQRSVWLRSIAAESSRRLPAADGAMFPFWSPDGKSIAFFAEHKLKKMALPDGVPLTVCDAPNGRGGTWNADGVIVFAPEGTSALYRVPAGGGTPSAVTKLDLAARQRSHRFPQFLADGRRFLFFAADSPIGEPGTIWLGSLDGRDPQRVLRSSTEATSAGPFFLTIQERALVARSTDASTSVPVGEPIPIGRLLQSLSVDGQPPFSVSANGTLAYWSSAPTPQQLVWLDRAGGALRRLGDPAVYGTPAMTHRGDRVVVPITSLDTLETSLWVLATATGQPSRVTVGLGPIQTSAAWSRGGDRLAFGAFGVDKPSDPIADSASVLYQQTLETGDREELLNLRDTAGYVRQPCFSHDDRVLVYAYWNGKTDWDIWALPLMDDRRPFPLVQETGAQSDPRVSPDGRWLAYHTRESGRSEVRVQAFRARSTTPQLWAASGTEPRWRADGKELFYLDSDGRLMVVPVSAAPGWQGATSRLLFDPALRIGGRPASFVPSPDGRRFLFQANVPDSPPSTIKVVIGLFEELKAKVAAGGAK